ncbi:MAG: hypothetical protein Q9183_005777, partial [Haloplaca sp. 2 TL-2023]
MTNSVFRIMDLPTEIRTHILSFLLPDRNPIACSTARSPTFANPYRNEDPLTWYPEASTNFHPRTDDLPCHPQILRANRKLYDEGFAYLYKRRTYTLDLSGFGFDFLREGTQMDTLPLFPYAAVPNFVIH